MAIQQVSWSDSIIQVSDSFMPIIFSIKFYAWMGKVSDSKQMDCPSRQKVRIRDISLGLLLYTLNFYTLHSPHKSLQLHNHAQEMSGLSDSTYIWEQFLSAMNTVKNPFRNWLNDERLGSCLHVATSSIYPVINILVTSKQWQFSHWSYFFLLKSGKVKKQVQEKNEWKAEILVCG